MKLRICKSCKKEFLPERSMQVACGNECAMIISRKICGKNTQIALLSQRKELRLAKLKLKTRSEWLREAQAAFNKWIRHRDKDEPCVSCRRYHSGQYHAGHYMPTSTRPSLRFDERNVHKQCSACNNHKHGNLINYRVGLISKIGLNMVRWLEGEHPPAKYTVEQLSEIKAKYTKLAIG